MDQRVSWLNSQQTKKELHVCLLPYLMDVLLFGESEALLGEQRCDTPDAGAFQELQQWG